MQPNREQVFGMLRVLLASGGPLAAFLISQGVDPDKVHAGLDLLVALLGFAPVVIAFVWGLNSNSNASKVQAVQSLPPAEKAQVLADMPAEQKILAASELPDVAAIVIKRDAQNGGAELAADVTLPKVVTEIK